MIDAPSLVDEDRERISPGRTFDEWSFPPNGTMSFAKNIPRDIGALLPHIPIFTAPKCSPPITNRRSDPSHPAHPHTPPSTTEEWMRPPPRKGDHSRRAWWRVREHHQPRGEPDAAGSHQAHLRLQVSLPAFPSDAKDRPRRSGDDHDYCEYTHHYSGRTAQEITVKSLSMAMGVRRPGYQLLSLAPTERGSGDAAAAATTLCLLPDQLHIYLGVYVPLLVLSLALIGAVNVLARYRRRSPHTSDGPWRSTSATRPFIRVVEQAQPSKDDFDEKEDEDALPAPASLSSGRRPPRPTRQRSSPGPGRSPSSIAAPLKRVLKTALMSARPGRQRSLTRDIFNDVRDVAILPLLLFSLITWWTMAY